MKKQRLVLAGNGMAGIRCIEEVLNAESPNVRNCHFRKRTASQL